MKTRKSHRTPRNALLFVREEAKASLDGGEKRTPAELLIALVKIERLCLEGLYPVGEAPCPVCAGTGRTTGDLTDDLCRNCGGEGNRT